MLSTLFLLEWKRSTFFHSDVLSKISNFTLTGHWILFVRAVMVFSAHNHLTINDTHLLWNTGFDDLWNAHAFCLYKFQPAKKETKTNKQTNERATKHINKWITITITTITTATKQIVWYDTISSVFLRHMASDLDSPSPSPSSFFSFRASFSSFS